MRLPTAPLAAVLALVSSTLLGLVSPTLRAQVPTGRPQLWHTLTFDFRGPSTDEQATPNPFTDYRFDLVLTKPDGSTMIVPGYYAADGDAAESSADSGDVWRALLVPDQIGTWTFQAEFTTGPLVASDGGGTATGFDGATGSFDVFASDKQAPDLRALGMLRKGQETLPRWAATGEPFLEMGTNSPENLLAYTDFDNTFDMGGEVPNFLHSFAPHVQDFAPLGGKTWQGGKGEGLFGAINYLASEGLNSCFVLTFTGYGDADDIWPWLIRDDPTRYDCSKLDQWARFFRHTQDRGLHVQLTLTETENEAFFELVGTDNTFDPMRKVYHREMVARFGHHLALSWNLGEENGWSAGNSSPYRRATTDAQRRLFSEHLRGLDPYNHPIVLHTHFSARGGESAEAIYSALLNPTNPAQAIDGASLQGPYDSRRSLDEPSDAVNANTHAKVRDWVDRSRAVGLDWIVGSHEQRPSVWGSVPDGASRDPNHDLTRKDVMWGTYMAGGTSVQHYFGYNFRFTTGDDVTVEDFRPRTDLWRQSRVVKDFFEQYLPYDRMDCVTELVAEPFAYAFGRKSEIYAVYLRNGTPTTLDLEGCTSEFKVEWYDPRNGGPLQAGSVLRVAGPGVVDLGTPPVQQGGSPTDDWVCLVRSTYIVPGTGCSDSLEPSIDAPAVFGERSTVTVANPQESLPTAILFGLRQDPAFPFPFPPVCSLDPTSCGVNVAPTASVSATSARVRWPVNPALIGAFVRIQTTSYRANRGCFELSKAIELQLGR